MRKEIKIAVIAIVIVAIVLTAALEIPNHLNFSSSPQSKTRTIVDMYGRTVTVPTKITRVLCTSPIEMEIVYMLAPQDLVGLPFSYNGNPSYVPTQYANISVVGGWYGQQTGNIETFLAAKPDVILDGTDDTNASLATMQQKFGTVPVVGCDAGNYLTQYAPEITFIGNLLGVKTQAQNLNNFYQNAMNYVNSIVSNISESARVRVYYAEGTAGLNTDPSGSMHTMLITFCGGVNIANVTLLPGYGMASTSMESIYQWNPQMIIIGRGSESTLYTTIMNSTLWNQLTAVKDNQVYIRPDNPFSWFDGPPGPGQILGMYWMVHILYPSQTTSLDLSQKVQQFYSEFYHYDLTSAQVQTLLSGGNL
jgi:iron complex transport system substrate-binding protein